MASDSDYAELRQFACDKEDLRELIRRVAGLPIASEVQMAQTKHRDESAVEAISSVRDVCGGLEKKIARDTFRVAVVGEYSTGKSSLLNVLLRQLDPGGKKEDGLLPTAIAPTTAAITILRQGRDASIEVVTGEGATYGMSRRDLGVYLAEPALWARLCTREAVREREEIAASIAEVRVTCDSPLLQQGVEIVDTPGLGSVHPEHGAATRRFVTEVDAALFVICVDPPMGEKEQTFLQHVRACTERLVMVQNKMDLGERVEKGEPVYARLEREHRLRIGDVLGDREYSFFHVSARWASMGLRGDEIALRKSRLLELEAYLQKFLVQQPGAERFRQWARTLRQAFGRLAAALEERRRVFHEQQRGVEAELASIGDLEALEEQRQVFEKCVRHHKKKARKEVQACKELVSTCVADDLRLKLKQADLNALSKGDGVSRLERYLTAALQQHISAAVGQSIADTLKACVKAAHQTLGERVPAALRRFRSAPDAREMLEDISAPVDSSIILARSENTLQQATGFFQQAWEWLKSLFGVTPSTTRATSYSVDEERLGLVCRTATQSAVEAVSEAHCRQLDELRDMVEEELDAIKAASVKAAADKERSARASLEECQAELDSVQQQLAQLGRLELELERLAGRRVTAL